MPMPETLLPPDLLLEDVELVHKCEPMGPIVIGWEVLTPPILLLVTTMPPLLAPPGMPTVLGEAVESLFMLELTPAKE